MKKVLISFLLGAAVGWGGYWYVDNHKFWAWRTKQKVVNAAENTAQSLKEKFNEIKADVIREELAKSGIFISEKARQAGAVIADAASDGRITATIKARLLAEPGLASLNVHVTTTGGVVTLAGSAGSYEEIARIVRLAMEIEGVQKVISTLQVSPAQRAGG